MVIRAADPNPKPIDVTWVSDRAAEAQAPTPEEKTATRKSIFFEKDFLLRQGRDLNESVFWKTEGGQHPVHEAMASATSPEQRLDELREGLSARLARGSRETDDQVKQEVEKVFEAYLERVKRSGTCSEEDAKVAFEEAIKDWSQGKAEGEERDVFLRGPHQDLEVQADQARGSGDQCAPRDQ